MTSLQKYFSLDPSTLEIGVDEVGRGPLLGRVYAAAVILPKDGSFLGRGIKDSKKIHSKKKFQELADFIKTGALAYHIEYVEAVVIDQINIRQAVLRAMHECIKQVILKTDAIHKEEHANQYMLLIDGNDFKPYCRFDEASQEIVTLPHETIEGGDNKYLAIAAASILAKHSRDEYILELCREHPELAERYKLDTNMGYGTKHHMDGIAQYGITEWHRKSYKPCSK
jgi:ribonuclease HII